MMMPSIRECGEQLIDIRKQQNLLYGPPPECPETEPHYCLMRLGVYERLLRAQAKLPRGYRLRLYEGLRSRAVQGQLFEQEKARVFVREPTLTPEEVHNRATMLVSPPTFWDGSDNTTPHSTGGAVDVEIVDAKGSVIDFGMEIREWVSVEPSFCAPSHPALREGARRNRSLLAEIMLQEGFVRYHSEWWHFSYGDQYWAREKAKEFAFYGACTPEMLDKERLLLLPG